MARSLFVCLVAFIFVNVHAQDSIVDKIINVRNLLASTSELDHKEALSQLLSIEKECAQSSNDTLKAVFGGLKGQALFMEGKYKECIEPSKEAIELFEKCNLRQYDFLDAYKIISFSYHRLYDFENAEESK